MNRNFFAKTVIPPAPHEADPVFERIDSLGNSLDPPTILLSLEAYVDTTAIISVAGSEEIGWLGTVKKLPDEHYEIGRVFLFPQEVGHSHTEFDPAGLGKFYTDLLKQDPANREMLSSILFWGHLHPGDMTGASDQDEDQMTAFAHNEFFIRGIFTRGGKCVFTFYDYRRGLKITDCPWQITCGTERKAAMAKEVAEKVRKPKMVPSRILTRKGVPPWDNLKQK